MTKTVLAVVLLLSCVSVFAQDKSSPTYEEGTVVASPKHKVYVIESATIRYNILGDRALVLNEVVHFRIEKGHKAFVILIDGKEYKYWLNEQEPIHHPN
jgi:hypothetical protein